MRNREGRATPAPKELGCISILGLQDGPEAIVEPHLLAPPAPPSVRTQNFAVRETMLYLLTSPLLGSFQPHPLSDTRWGLLPEFSEAETALH